MKNNVAFYLKDEIKSNLYFVTLADSDISGKSKDE